eukprot:5102370-Pyramimonas_sp.AAC.1
MSCREGTTAPAGGGAEGSAGGHLVRAAATSGVGAGRRLPTTAFPGAEAVWGVADLSTPPGFAG